MVRHSPLTGIFLIRRCPESRGLLDIGVSQSPDGDFFDPENPTTGQVTGPDESQSPDGDFFDPEPRIPRATRYWCQVTVP